MCAAIWKQHEITLPSFKRGCHIITGKTYASSLPCRQIDVCNFSVSRSRKVQKFSLKIVLFPRSISSLTADIIVQEIAPSIKPLSSGLCHVFIKHTSCGLTINENADPDVRKDMETFFNLVVPEGHSAPWVHRDEGPDDMPAHIKSSMMGSSVTIPITRGRLNLGTWQGVWLCECRDAAGRRNIVVTVQGSTN